MELSFYIYIFKEGSCRSIKRITPYDNQHMITYFPFTDDQLPASKSKENFLKVFNSNPDSNLRVGNTQLIEGIKPCICMRK